MEEAESAHRRPEKAAPGDAGAEASRTYVRGDRRAVSLRLASSGVAARRNPLGLNPLEAAAWVALYTFAFRFIVSVHLSAMPGAQLADLAVPGGGMFTAVWSCHEFDGQNNKSPAVPIKKGGTGERCMLCAAVAGSAAALPDDGLALSKPQFTSFSLTPAISIRLAAREYFHARPRGPPALSA